MVTQRSTWGHHVGRCSIFGPNGKNRPFLVCAAALELPVTHPGKTLKWLKTVSSLLMDYERKKKMVEWLFLLLFRLVLHVLKDLEIWQKRLFFCVGCLTHSLLQYRDLAVIAAALLPVHFVDFILATIDVQLLNFTHILWSNVKIIVLGKTRQTSFCLRRFCFDFSDLTSFFDAKIKICEKGLLMPIYGHVSQLLPHWLVCR